MAKDSAKEFGGRNSSGIQRISSVDNPNSGGPGLFVAALGLILLAGIAAIVFFALNRESNIGVAPEASIDHWHSAYLVHDCGSDLPATAEFPTTDGLHTHGDGLLHIHPYNPTVSGNNATLGEYFLASGAELTDVQFSTGNSDFVSATMSEEAGCEGEDAVLQLAVWRNAFDELSEPEIITENLADFQFETAGMAVTLALLPEGSEIPRPPADRIASLSTTGAGGPIFGVEVGESPVVTASTIAPVEDETSDADADAETDAADDETDESEAADEAMVESSIAVTAAQASIVLAGTVADEATRDEVVARAVSVYSEDQVDDQLVIDASAVPPAVLTIAGSMTDPVLFEQVTTAFDGIDGVEVGDATITLEESGEIEASLNGLEPIQFASGSAVIDPASLATLDQAAEFLKADATVAVEIGGHTDSTGEEGPNQSLSQARADSVLAALVEREVTNEMTAVGFGESRLQVPDEGDLEAQQQNRRIEFRVTG
ncbi:MAG: OmpA family protein [Acidimicrobiales bacterium]